MTEKELENLLRDPAVRHDLGRVVGDPLLWLEQDKLPQNEEERLSLAGEIKGQLKARVLEKLAEDAPRVQQRMLRRHGHMARYVLTAAAAVALLFTAFFMLLPQGRTMASALGALVTRKVTGHVVVESAGDPPPGVIKSSGMRISGVDGYEMNAYQSLDEYIQKTGRRPVVLTGGYRTVEQISDETDPETGSYTLMIVYVAPNGGYITTNQVWKKDAAPYIVPNSFERQTLGKTMYCTVDEDSTFTTGSMQLAQDCVFYLAVPYEMNFDTFLPQLAWSDEIDTRAFAITLPTPDPNQPQQERRTYQTLEAFIKDAGYYPVALENGYGALTKVEYYPSTYAPQTMVSIYKVDGHEVTIILQWGNVDGMVMSMEDSTYFETKVLGDYTMRASVDKKDGSTAGIVTLDHAVLSVFAEKDADFQDIVAHLIQMKPRMDGEQ